MSDLINDYIRLLKSDVAKVFPDAVSVEIFVSADEVRITPNYTVDRSCNRTLSGNWINAMEDKSC